MNFEKTGDIFGSILALYFLICGIGSPFLVHVFNLENK